MYIGLVMRYGEQLGHMRNFAWQNRRANLPAEPYYRLTVLRKASTSTVNRQPSRMSDVVVFKTVNRQQRLTLLGIVAYGP